MKGAQGDRRVGGPGGASLLFPTPSLFPCASSAPKMQPLPCRPIRTHLLRPLDTGTLGSALGVQAQSRLVAIKGRPPRPSLLALV